MNIDIIQASKKNITGLKKTFCLLVVSATFVFPEVIIKKTAGIKPIADSFVKTPNIKATIADTSHQICMNRQ